MNNAYDDDEYEDDEVPAMDPEIEAFYMCMPRIRGLTEGNLHRVIWLCESAIEIAREEIALQGVRSPEQEQQPIAICLEGPTQRKAMIAQIGIAVVAVVVEIIGLIVTRK